MGYPDPRTRTAKGSRPLRLSRVRLRLGAPSCERRVARPSHRFARLHPRCARHRASRESFELGRACPQACSRNPLGVAVDDASEPTSALRTLLFEHPHASRAPGARLRLGVDLLVPRLSPRARSRSVLCAPPSRLATGERAPKGSGPLDASEAGGWRVFTTRFSASATRTIERGALSSAASIETNRLLASLSPPSIHERAIEPDLSSCRRPPRSLPHAAS